MDLSDFEIFVYQLYKLGLYEPTYDFVFLDNFIALFHDSRFYDALLNTLLFTLGTLIPTLIGGLLLALLLQRNFRGSGIYKFILFSPWVTPTVAISIVWVWIFEPDTGIANAVLQFFICRGFSGYRVRTQHFWLLSLLQYGRVSGTQ